MDGVLRPAPPLAGLEPAVDRAGLERAVAGIAAFIVSTTSPERDDRLWPADAAVFGTNPLSLAHGACGVALFLHDAGIPLPPAAERWLLACELTLDAHPPGLYAGLGGIAVAFLELGFAERAREAMDLAERSPLRFAEHGFFQGAAGIGVAELLFHRRTGDDAFLGRARTTAEHLVGTAERSAHGLFWRVRGQDAQPIGLGYGSAGAALFLLHAARVLEEPAYASAARAALAHDAARAVEEEGRLLWRPDEEDGRLFPYWLQGAAGVGSVAVRFHAALGEARHLELAVGAAEGAFTPLAVSPEQFLGLSGIGEFMLDMYLATGDAEYLRRAHIVAETVLCYAIEEPDGGLAFPGRGLARISTDFGTGSAGIGAFLLRLADPGPRRFHDLDG